MLHHVSVGVRNIAQAADFYDTVLGTLGYTRVFEVLPYAIGYGDKAPLFWIQLPRGQQELTVGNGAHIALSATTKEAVDAFHAKALEKGATDDGAPGPRPDYGPDYYAAFVIDPDGNRLEAVLQAPAPAAKPKKAKASAKAAKATKAAKKAIKTTAQKPAKKTPAKPAKSEKAKPAKTKPVKAAAKAKSVKKLVKKAVKKVAAKAARAKAVKKVAPKKVAPKKIAPKKTDKKKNGKKGKK